MNTVPLNIFNCKKKNKNHLCRRATPSAKVQERAALGFHPNLLNSNYIKRKIYNLLIYCLLFRHCVLTQGISMPHPETQTVDWVMLVTPGFCQATSRCTVDLRLALVGFFIVRWNKRLTPFRQYREVPQSHHIETSAWTFTVLLIHLFDISFKCERVPKYDTISIVKNIHSELITEIIVACKDNLFEIIVACEDKLRAVCTLQCSHSERNRGSFWETCTHVDYKNSSQRVQNDLMQNVLIQALGKIEMGKINHLKVTLSNIKVCLFDESDNYFMSQINSTHIFWCVIYESNIFMSQINSSPIFWCAICFDVSDILVSYIFWWVKPAGRKFQSCTLSSRFLLPLTERMVGLGQF